MSCFGFISFRFALLCFGMLWFGLQSRLAGHWHDHRCLSVIIEHNYGENRISAKKNTIHIQPRRFHSHTTNLSARKTSTIHGVRSKASHTLPYLTNSDDNAIVIMQTSSFIHANVLLGRSVGLLVRRLS